jgi:hypothetical protein
MRKTCIAACLGPSMTKDDMALGATRPKSLKLHQDSGTLPCAKDTAQQNLYAPGNRGIRKLQNRRKSTEKVQCSLHATVCISPHARHGLVDISGVQLQSLFFSARVQRKGLIGGY